MKATLVSTIAVSLGMCHVGSEYAIASGTANFQEVKRQYEELRSDLSSPFSKLDRRYAEELRALREKAVGNGNLDLILEIEHEVRSLESGDRGSISSREELARIQRIYRDEKERLSIGREQRLKDLVRAYIEKLRTLEKSLTTKEQIESALEVREELHRVGHLSEALNFSDPDILVSRQWIRRDVKLRKKRVFEFGEDGGISAVDVRSSWVKWESVGRTIVMFLANGDKYEFVIRREERPIVMEETGTGRKEFFFVEKEG